MEDKISYEDFAKVEMRVGEIKGVEDHPNADKLFVMNVDFGQEVGERTIVAGLRGFYEKEDLQGKKAIFVTNLEPVMLRGVESQGMILAAVSSDRKEARISTVDGNIQNGTRIS